MPAVRHATNTRAPTSASALVGPLSGETFRDPVIAPDGVTYDRLALAAHQARTGRFVDGGPPVPDRQLYRFHGMRERVAGMNTRLDDGVPEYLYDPITADVMRDPVVASDGRTYDVRTVEQLLAQQNGISPYTRERLDEWVYRSESLRDELVERGLPVADAETGAAVDLGSPRRERRAQLRRRRFRRAARGNLALTGMMVGVVGGAAGAIVATAGLATPLVLTVLIASAGGSLGSSTGMLTGDQLGRVVGGRRVAGAVGVVRRGLRRAFGREALGRRRPAAG